MRITNVLLSTSTNDPLAVPHSPLRHSSHVLLAYYILQAKTLHSICSCHPPSGAAARDSEKLRIISRLSHPDSQKHDNLKGNIFDVIPAPARTASCCGPFLSPTPEQINQ